jgi:hypothetical protein
MALKMRPTGLGHGVYKDNADYGVFCGEWCIGRIYQTRTGPESLRWFWALHAPSKPGEMRTSNQVATLEAAKAQFGAREPISKLLTVCAPAWCDGSKARRFGAYYRVLTERRGTSGLGATTDHNKKAFRGNIRSGPWRSTAAARLFLCSPRFSVVLSLTSRGRLGLLLPQARNDAIHACERTAAEPECIAPASGLQCGRWPETSKRCARQYQ